MKQFLLALFILSAGFIKSQCSLTASTTPPSCPGNCDGSVVLTLAGCSAFPYNMTVNSGSCTPITATSFTAATMTFTGLCNCTSLYNVVLTNTLSFPVAFTNFAELSGNGFMGEINYFLFMVFKLSIVLSLLFIMLSFCSILCLRLLAIKYDTIFQHKETIIMIALATFQIFSLLVDFRLDNSFFKYEK